MAANMETLISEVQLGFIPGGGEQLIATMEAFPDFAEYLGTALTALADFMSGELGDAETGSLVADMAGVAGVLNEAAQQAAVQFTQRSNFWTA